MAERAWLCGVVLGLLAVQPAYAVDAWRAACPDPGAEDYGRCLAVFAGGPTATEIVAKQSEMIRVVVDQGVRIVDPIVVIEFVLPKAGPARLVVRDPVTRGYSRSYDIPRDTFEKLRQHLMGLREQGAVLHGAAPAHNLPDRYLDEPSHDGFETVCLDGSSGFVEAVLHGSVTSAWLGVCDTKDHSLVEMMESIAEPLDPICALLPDHKVWWAEELRECLHLRGDRRTAAEGFGSATALGNALVDQDRKAIKSKIADDARLIVGEQLIATGSSGILAWWSQIAARGYLRFNPVGATGGGDRILVTGMIDQIFDAPDETRFRAASVQTWQRNSDGEIHLVQWHIGESRAE